MHFGVLDSDGPTYYMDQASMQYLIKLSTIIGTPTQEYDPRRCNNALVFMLNCPWTRIKRPTFINKQSLLSRRVYNVTNLHGSYWRKLLRTMYFSKPLADSIKKNMKQKCWTRKLEVTS